MRAIEISATEVNVDVASDVVAVAASSLGVSRTLSAGVTTGRTGASRPTAAAGTASWTGGQSTVSPDSSRRAAVIVDLVGGDETTGVACGSRLTEAATGPVAPDPVAPALVEPRDLITLAPWPKEGALGAAGVALGGAPGTTGARGATFLD